MSGSHFKLQRCVTAAGREGGHGGVDEAVWQQGATGGLVQPEEGVVWEGRCDGWQWAKQVVQGCWCHLWHVLGTTLLKRCIDLCEWEQKDLGSNIHSVFLNCCNFGFYQALTTTLPSCSARAWVVMKNTNAKKNCNNAKKYDWQM